MVVYVEEAFVFADATLAVRNGAVLLGYLHVKRHQTPECWPRFSRKVGTATGPRDG